MIFIENVKGKSRNIIMRYRRRVKYANLPLKAPQIAPLCG
jgi:hypothetical protein